jgi:hypothetical protein
MRPALIALALASAALAQDGPSGPLHTDDGHVIRATLASGAIVDLSGPMDASIEGSRARLRHGSGLHASARLVDVEVQLASTVSVAAGSIELSCGAAITARTASRGGVRIDARALSVRLRDVEVPRASITLRGATRPANAICSAPLPERFSAVGATSDSLRQSWSRTQDSAIAADADGLVSRCDRLRLGCVVRTDPPRALPLSPRDGAALRLRSRVGVRSEGGAPA